MASGLSSSARWLAPETMTSSDCGSEAAINLEYSSGVNRSWSPHAIRVGTFSSVHNPAVSSCVSSARRKPTRVAIGVPFIIRCENASRLRLTCRSLKEAARRIGPISERDTLRPRCISLGADLAVNRTASSAGFFRNSPSGERVTPSAADESSAAPTIRCPYCVGKLPGVRHHRHTAHRMADQHDRPARRCHLQHGFQVLAQLGQRVGLGLTFTGLAVPTLVIEDHPHLRTQNLTEPRPLKVEGAHAQTESVGEDHGQRGVHRAGLAHRQRNPVGGRHDLAAIAVQSLEILIGPRIFTRGGSFDDRLAGRGADEGGDGGQPGAARQPCLAFGRLRGFGQRLTGLRPRGRFW